MLNVVYSTLFLSKSSTSWRVKPQRGSFGVPLIKATHSAEFTSSFSLVFKSLVTTFESDCCVVVAPAPTAGAAVDWAYFATFLLSSAALAPSTRSIAFPFYIATHNTHTHTKESKDN